MGEFDEKTFNYIHLKCIPMKKSAKGMVMNFDREKLDRLVAEAIVVNPVPLRGIEVKFLRQVMGLSLNKAGTPLGITASAIFYWESAPETRLTIVNEVAFRSLAAERLGFMISGKLSSLLGKETPPTIEISLGADEKKGRTPKTRRSKK